MKNRLVLWLLLLMPSALLAFPPELQPFFTAIRQQESANHPWSIFDNTTRVSYKLPSRAAAEATAKDLVARGHNLDLGLHQLNWRWQQSRPGLTLDNVFDPVMNENVARTILVEFYTAAKNIYASTDDAIRMAVGAYNNGKVRVDNQRYVNGVYRLAGLSPPYSDTGLGTRAPTATPLRGAAPSDEGGVGSEMARWFKGSPSLAVLLDASDAQEDSEPEPVMGGLLLTIVVSLVVLAVGIVLLLLVVKLAPLLFSSAGVLAKRLLWSAVLRANRKIGAETSRLGTP